jgi:hypothetical protein
VLAELDGANVDVGWFENALYPNGESVAGVMAANEFGNSRLGTPARPLLRQSAEKVETKLPGWVARRTDEMLAGQLSADAMKKRMGETLVATVLETLKEGKFEDNAESTIERKGFNKPLVETSELGQSVTHRIK